MNSFSLSYRGPGNVAGNGSLVPTYTEVESQTKQGTRLDQRCHLSEPFGPASRILRSLVRLGVRQSKVLPVGQQTCFHETSGEVAVVLGRR